MAARSSWPGHALSPDPQPVAQDRPGPARARHVPEGPARHAAVTDQGAAGAHGHPGQGQGVGRSLTCATATTPAVRSSAPPPPTRSSLAGGRESTGPGARRDRGLELLWRHGVLCAPPVRRLRPGRTQPGAGPSAARERPWPADARRPVQRVLPQLAQDRAFDGCTSGAGPRRQRGPFGRRPPLRPRDAAGAPPSRRARRGRRTGGDPDEAETPLAGLRVVPYYGCLLTRPVFPGPPERPPTPNTRCRWTTSWRPSAPKWSTTR